ncbi:hypothetical protein Metfor_0436 [Methanoregula formicica SMSP]|uniref:Uncharacterized protein n=2 Tax=Methanoregula formicica TaxID=882104 RepID=L0HDV2_METFS|nr:hypothetical protein Metfor_0436 [Methanoregula formicica SMSP]
MWAISRRWVLLIDSDSVQKKDAFSAVWIGYLGNAILPFRLGEIIRSYFLSKKSCISIVQLLTTIIIEKLFDICFLLGLFFVISLFLPLPSWIIFSGKLIAGLVLILIICLILIYKSKKSFQDVCLKIFSKLPLGKFRQYIEPCSNSFILGFKVFNNPFRFIQITLWTLIIWSFAFLLNSCILWSLGIDTWLPLSFMTLVVNNLGMVIPSMPSNIGVYHYLAIVTLSIFNINPVTALSYAILSHIINFGSFIIGGLIALIINREDIGSFFREALEAEK